MTVSLPEWPQDRLGMNAGLAQGSQECGFETVRDNPDGAGLHVGFDASTSVKSMEGACQDGDAAVHEPLGGREAGDAHGAGRAHSPMIPSSG